MLTRRAVVLCLCLLAVAGLSGCLRFIATRNPGNTAKMTNPTPGPRDGALITAVIAGDAAEAQSLLAQGASANTRDYTDHPHRHGVHVSEAPAIIVATERRDLELVEILLNHGADANARTKQGETVLRVAAGRGDILIMEELLSHGANVNTRAPLIEAAFRGNVAAVRLLLKHKADPNARGGPSGTALCAAAQCRPSEYPGSPTICAETAKVLIAHGADPRATDGAGRTALQHATGPSGNPLAAQVLRGQRLKIIPSDPTPLTAAARCGGVTRMKTLIAAGADVNARDGRGSTPLMAVARYGLETPLQRVFMRGVQVRTGRQTRFGSVEGRSTSVSVSQEFDMILKRRAAMIEILFDPKAGLKIEGGKNAGAVFRAALAGEVATLGKLLAQGADPSPQDAGGFTPLMGAATLGDADIIKLLLKHGANKKVKDRNGQTAQFWLPFSSNAPIEAEQLLR